MEESSLRGISAFSSYREERPGNVYCDKYERAKSRCMVLRREILRNEKIISKQERRILGLETPLKRRMNVLQS